MFGVFGLLKKLSDATQKLSEVTPNINKQNQNMLPKKPLKKYVPPFRGIFRPPLMPLEFGLNSRPNRASRPRIL